MNIDKVIEIYIAVDDFMNNYAHEMQQLRLKSGLSAQRNRASRLSDSEMMTILICFHLSHYTNFKAFYTEYVCVHWTAYFPDLISYERFNQSQKKLFVPLLVFLKTQCLGACRGISFIDSTTLKVCHIKREKQHRTFKHIATKGKGTMGWFYGFKLHLIINDKGQLLSFYLSKANTDDRNMNIINVLSKNMFGKLFGDRGYISKVLADYLWNDGIHLVYKLRKNMKKQNLSDIDKILLRKRSLIESVNDELKNICSIEHTRHRSTSGFFINMIAAMSAYHFLPKKPSLNIKPVYDNNNNQLLLAA